MMKGPVAPEGTEKRGPRDRPEVALALILS